jgi:hypothetical protein
MNRMPSRAAADPETLHVIAPAGMDDIDFVRAVSRRNMESRYRALRPESRDEPGKQRFERAL